MADNRRSFNPMIRAMSQSLSLAEVRQMASQGVVVLSPHFDDGCFSLGGLLTAMNTGLLVNVFNRSMHLPKSGTSDALPDAEALASEVRGQEDQIFADRCGLRRCQLDGAEPGFFGRRPNDLSGVTQDIEAIADAMIDKLKQLASEEGVRPWLMVPMAVGRHVNHHAVHQIVLRHRNFLQSAFRLAFYEDLPYAHEPLSRMTAIKRFKSQWGPAMTRATWASPWSHKQLLVMIYASQHRRKPSLLKYRPAALWPFDCHEALWLNPQDLA
jgi:LmbE family N-acetylglucosaminyl deacetylase